MQGKDHIQVEAMVIEIGVLAIENDDWFMASVNILCLPWMYYPQLTIYMSVYIQLDGYIGYLQYTYIHIYDYQALEIWHT